MAQTWNIITTSLKTFYKLQASINTTTQSHRSTMFRYIPGRL